MRPALANLFAYHHNDPSKVDEMERTIKKGGDFRFVLRPAAGWIAGVKPLPGSPDPPSSLTQAGLIFAEGEDLFTGESAARRHRLEELLRTLDSNPESLDRLPGDFGLVRLKGLPADAAVVRSCGGLVPFYVHSDREEFAVATRLGDFARYVLKHPRLDPLVNATWTSGYSLFPDDRSFLSDVSMLPRGGVSTFRDGKPSRRLYWKPWELHSQKPTAEMAQQRAEKLGDALIGTLERDLDPTGGNLLTLSGGVDSSALGALAGARFPVWTASLVPSEWSLLEHELSYINPLAAQFRFERMWFFSPGPKPAVAEHQAPPGVLFQVVHPLLLRLPEIAAEADVKVLFGGEFADAVCGSIINIPDWACAVPLPRLVEIFASGSLPFGRRDLLRWVKHRSLRALRRPKVPFPTELPEWIRPEVREEYAEWVARRRALAARERSGCTTLRLATERDGFIAMNWEAAGALGIRRCFPFITRPVLELAFSAHPEELIGPGTKKILKKALQGKVPDRNLHRADKGLWGRGHSIHRSTYVVPEELDPGLEQVVQREWFPRPPGPLLRQDFGGIAQLGQISAQLRHIAEAKDLSFSPGNQT